MLSPTDIKALELRAYGKRITFHTKYHWILTWLEERPGKNLADKVGGIINTAYQSDYESRGQAEIDRYWALCAAFDYSNPDPQQAILGDMINALSNACEYFNRAENKSAAAVAQDLLHSVIFQKVKRAA